MRFRAIALVIIMSCIGCETPLGVQYELEDGTVVACRSILFITCGVNLSFCTDGNQYFCQRNVRVLE